MKKNNDDIYSGSFGQATLRTNKAKLLNLRGSVHVDISPPIGKFNAEIYGVQYEYI